MFKRLIFFRVGHILLDLLLLYLGFLLAYGVRVGWVMSTDFPFVMYAGLSLLGAGLWMGFLLFTKYYRLPPRSGLARWYDFGLVFVGGVVANGFLVVSYFFPRDILFSRLLSLYAFLFGVFFLCCTHLVSRLVFSKKNKQLVEPYKTLIIGANKVTEKLIEAINTNPYALYEVIGVIDPYGLKKSIKGSEILGKLNKLDDVCVDKKVTAIIQCDAYEHTLNIISFCEEKDIKYQFDPALRGIYEKNLRIREVAGQTMISFVKRDFDSKKKRTLYDVFDRVMKQVFDVD